LSAPPYLTSRACSTSQPRSLRSGESSWAVSMESSVTDGFDCLMSIGGRTIPESQREGARRFPPLHRCSLAGIPARGTPGWRLCWRDLSRRTHHCPISHANLSRGAPRFCFRYGHTVDSEQASHKGCQSRSRRGDVQQSLKQTVGWRPFQQQTGVYFPHSSRPLLSFSLASY
jgi:hypothetical protein